MSAPVVAHLSCQAIFPSQVGPPVRVDGSKRWRSFEAVLVCCATAGVSFSAINSVEVGVRGRARSRSSPVSCTQVLVVTRSGGTVSSAVVEGPVASSGYVSQSPDCCAGVHRRSYDPDQPYWRAIDRGSFKRCVAGGVIHIAVMAEMCVGTLVRLAPLTERTLSCQRRIKFPIALAPPTMGSESLLLTNDDGYVQRFQTVFLSTVKAVTLMNTGLYSLGHSSEK